jgi:hypothetical protein
VLDGGSGGAGGAAGFHAVAPDLQDS